MKPANFEFARAATLAEAAAILRQADGAKVVAGGQSLGPMLNLRLVQPSILVDITAIPELTRIEEDADWLSLGACITTSDIEDGRVPVAELPILMTVAGGVAYRAVRNRGTVGGSICHADPAGDWLPALLALACRMRDLRWTPGATRADRAIRDRRVRGDARNGRIAASHPHPAPLAQRPVRILQGVPEGRGVCPGERRAVARSRSWPYQSRHRRNSRAAHRHR